VSYCPGDEFLPWDVQSFEQLAALRLTQAVAIRRPVPTSDGAGGWVDVPTEIANSPAALTRMRTPREILVGEGMAGVADYHLLLPLETDIGPADDVLPWWLWQVSLGAPTAGTFTLTYGGYTTPTLPYNLSAATLSLRFERLASVGAGRATVLGPAGGPYQIRFARSLQGRTEAITANFTGLTSGDGRIERPVFNVLAVDDGVIDAPQLTVYLSRRRP
jgi:hypothetical protein